MQLIKTGLFVALASTLAACGGKVSSSDVGSSSGASCADHNGDDPAVVCEQWAKAQCEYSFRCGSRYVVPTSYKSQEACVASDIAWCVSFYGAAGFADWKGSVWAGSEEYSRSTCKRPDTSSGEACPIGRGTLEDGTKCFLPGQCKGGWCSLTYGQQCGICQSLAKEGGSCKGINCETGLGCESGICKKLTPVGEACESSSQCANNASCESGKCTKPTPQPLFNVGESCDGDRHCFLGLWCYDGICREPVIAKEGESCGDLTWCDWDLSCVNGKCEKYIPGASCVASDFTCRMGQYCNGTICVDRIPPGGTCSPNTPTDDINNGCEPGYKCVNSKCASWSMPSVCM